MKSIALLSLALFLFACGETTPDTATAPVDDVPVVEAPPATPQTNPLLQSTVDAVQTNGGDITALSPYTAVANIDNWIDELRNMEGTDGIVNDLEALKMELGMDNIDGGKVSNLLSSLASSTRQVGNGNPGLNALASALDAGASKLGGK
jgi:hypothetical protein